mmetsp:Transcript_7782/g.10207  ORF Transcript_7782/g.10207 Transcript_7782/m.10207 type:complete len:156 (+) Transcript_7782:156-623(+)|eukprot:CAMPEP_0198145012 /NCGR_PEP_ID=MMETSP1443-20131203/20341_1 /TAXON_ID=186043 /ORGANISM="Entomoneis sp., Strain CCMP2396" /LENGTH=155 /DNA_ID=CAMNT_0043808523 /DNA_START=126 /DNA_END=593 /DNA_ORIENTATION=+
MKEMDYNTISRVTETWETCRRRCANFEDEVGTKMLKKLFELQPKTRTVFGFTKTEEPTVGDKHTSVHAHTVVSMFDSVLQMLGPDTELLEDILKQVGKRHKDFGVSPSYFPYMGQAITYALKETMSPGSFTEEHKDAWDEVYEELSSEILKSMLL